MNIKVDREERPDIDQIYQTAHQMLTQRAGGWPLTMFLTPDQKPFFGGTYFPKTARYGLPGFGELLRARRRESTASRARPSQRRTRSCVCSARGARCRGGRSVHIAAGRRPIAAALAAAASECSTQCTADWAARRSFRIPAELELVPARSRAATATRRRARWRCSRCAKMAEGGIYDQLGGGFCRYSVDEHWMIPHFEKMLYDNGPLLRLYADAWLVTRRAAVHARVRRDRGLGDARDAVARGRLLLLARRRLRARGGQVLRLDARRRCARCSTTEEYAVAAALRPGPAAQLRRASTGICAWRSRCDASRPSGIAIASRREALLARRAPSCSPRARSACARAATRRS